MWYFLKTKIEDFEKVEKPKPVTENSVDLGPVPPTTVNDDNGGNVKEDDGNTVDEPALDNDVPDEHVEQAPTEPPVEPQLIRSTREHRPSQRWKY